MKEHLNNYVQNLDTYIMFKIKQQMIDLTPELTAKGRAPINLLNLCSILILLQKVKISLSKLYKRE